MILLFHMSFQHQLVDFHTALDVYLNHWLREMFELIKTSVIVVRKWSAVK